MNGHELLARSDVQLAGMLSTHLPETWSEADLRAMLRQQLDLPAARVLAEEEVIDSAAAERAAAAMGGSGTLRDLLIHPAPPRELLDAARIWGKGLREEADAGVAAVRRVIYFAAIAAAQARLGVRLTQLDASQLKSGWTWVVSLAWVDEGLKAVIRSAAGRICGAQAR